MDKARKIGEMEESLKCITKELGILKAEYLKEKEKEKDKDKLVIEVRKSAMVPQLYLTYNGIIIVELRLDGVIVYNGSVSGRGAFEEWMQKGHKKSEAYVNFKHRQYHLSGTTSEVRLISETQQERSPIFNVSECYGSKNCTDSNIKVIPHNKRTIVIY